MRIAFFGATELGWACCRALIEAGQELVGVVSLGRNFRISWSPGEVTNVRHRSFEDIAAEQGVPLLDWEEVPRRALKERLIELRPELLVVAGWYHLLPTSLRGVARLGAVGVHASLLPRYRGGAPLVWAVIRGETRTGVSLFQLTDGVDDGDLLGQVELDIGPEEEISSLVARSTAAAVQLMRERVPLLGTPALVPVPQDPSLATCVPQRRPEDGLLDWTALTERSAHDWVRAQTRPYPGAFTRVRAERLTIWRARRGASSAPEGLVAGQVIVEPDRLGVVCADGGVLLLVEVELQGGAPGAGHELARALGLATGERLG